MAWDGPGYDGVADPQAATGADVVHRLDVPAGGCVIDAGCGSGRVTEVLLDRRPDVRVIGLDASTSMLDTARARLERFGPRIELRAADLADPWPIDEPADAVISTSAFHWVIDHEQLFAHVFDALGPGGILVAECGGHGSLQNVRQAADDVGVAVQGRNNYSTAEDARVHLTSVGFHDVWTWLQPVPITFATRPELATYLRDGALAPYDGGAEAAEAVAEALPEPIADFVRLNLLARR